MQPAWWRWVTIAVALSASSALAVDLRSPGIAPQALHAQLGSASAPLIVDVRSPTEYSAGHVPGALNIPAPTVTRHLERLRKAEDLVLYCNDRRFTAVAERLLTKAKVEGYSHLEGGLSAWREQGLPLETALPE
jgi:rhodanese-related sulfurtransferase